MEQTTIINYDMYTDKNDKIVKSEHFIPVVRMVLSGASGSGNRRNMSRKRKRNNIPSIR